MSFMCQCVGCGKFSSGAANFTIVCRRDEAVRHRMSVPNCDECDVLQTIGDTPGYFPYGTSMKTINKEAVLGATSCMNCKHRQLMGKDTVPRYRHCGKCKNATYCSPECQREHWATHRGDCKTIVKGRSAGLVTTVKNPGPFRPCVCYNGDPVLLRIVKLNHFGSNACCWIKCNKPVGVSVAHYFITKCSEVPGTSHKAVVGFCTSSCKIKFLNHAIEKDRALDTHADDDGEWDIRTYNTG